MRPETTAAVAAVRAALGLVRARGGAADVTGKGDRDVVTATDVAVEDAVRAVLGDAVVGEERGGRAAGTYWLVDPLCGTRNYASGIPLCCVNVALVEDGAVTVAVVGDPSSDELLVAERGGGAWALRDAGGVRPLRSDATSRAVVVEVSHAAGERRERAAAFLAAAVRADRFDLLALSTTLSLAYVASGRVAAYVLCWTSPVHAAAGSLLAAEAGAVVTDLDGAPWALAADSIVASGDPALHDELLALLSG